MWQCHTRLAVIFPVLVQYTRNMYVDYNRLYFVHALIETAVAMLGKSLGTIRSTEAPTALLLLLADNNIVRNITRLRPWRFAHSMQSHPTSVRVVDHKHHQCQDLSRFLLRDLTFTETFVNARAKKMEQKTSHGFGRCSAALGK